MITAVVERKKPILGPAPLSDEWLARRFDGFGSSELAKAVGLSDYGTPLSLYAEKKGLVEPFAGNAHTERGLRYEPLILSEWERETGIKIAQYPSPMFIHPDHPWLFATPDGIIDDTQGVDAKCPTFRQRSKFGDEGTDWIPSDYVIQGQGQCAVMGWDRAHFAVKMDLHEPPLHFTVERDDDFIAKIIRIAKELWDRIVAGTPPAPDWEHSRTPDLIKSLHGLTEGRTIALEADAGETWIAQRELGQQIKAMEESREILRAKVLHAMGDAAIAIIPEHGIEVTRSRVNRAAYEVKATSYVTLRERKAKAKR